MTKCYVVTGLGWAPTRRKGPTSSAKSCRSQPFGMLKEQQGGRRFLLRGIMNVKAEWDLLATAFNLRTLWKVWAAAGAQWWNGRWEQAVAA